MHTKTFALGAALGAAAMYLLDPPNGAARRAKAKAAAEDAKAQAEQLAASPAAQKVAGAAIDATRPLHDRGPGSDVALADKVRSEVLGHEPFADLTINLDAHDSTVVLRGVVDDLSLRQQLVTRVREVGGVEEVQSYLHAQDEPAPNMT